MMKKLLLFPILLILISSISYAQIGNISDDILGDFIFDGVSGLKPDIITLNENITIVVYTGAGNDGFVKTINMSSSNGSIFNTIDTFEWDIANGFEARIINVNDTIYAIASRGSQGDGFLDTINISNQGIISQAVIDSLEFDVGGAEDPDIVKVNDGIFAIFYRDADTDGRITTINISGTGQITDTIISTSEFEPTNADDIDILNITKNTFIIAFRGDSPSNGVITTINISNNGIIGSVINNVTFDPDGFDPEIIRIGTSTTYAVAYQNSTSNGRMKTFEILDNGSIIQELDDIDYDTAGTDVNLISIADDIIALVYSGVGNDGFARTFNIQSNGIINPSSIDFLEFDITNALNPRITQVIGDIYSVAYEDASSFGVVRSFNITTPVILNTTNLDVFLSKNPVEILESFTLFANYTNATSGLPVLNATCFANSSQLSGGTAGFGRGILGIGGLSTIGNAVHTQVAEIFGNNTLRVDIDNVPLGKASYAINLRVHGHNQSPADNLRIFATCHNNLSFSNFTLFGQVNSTEAVMSISTGNDTIWGFKNIVLFGESVATSNCSIVFESRNTSFNKHYMIADTTTDFNLNNSFTSDDFGETYTLRANANERSPFVDAGFGLDVPNETTMTFNSTSGLYFLPNIRHGRPFDFIDRVFCSADNFLNATDFVITNVEDNVPPIVQILSIDPTVAVINISNVTIQWIVNDPELLINFINISFPNGSLVIQTEAKPLILTPAELTEIGNYSVVAFANDTGGLFTIANGTFEVAVVDVTPPVITLIAPSNNINNTINNTIPLNISFSVTDNFPNDITCSLTNSTTIFATGTFTQGTDINFTLAEGELVLSQNFPNLQLTCSDNSDPFNNSATVLLNLTLDTVPPIIFALSPPNLIVFNKEVVSSIRIRGNCTDVPVFRFNITIDNATDRVFSFEDRTPINNIIGIDETLSITDLGVGNYTVSYECADPHTKNIIDDYKIKKSRNETESRTRFEIGNNNIDIAYQTFRSNIETLSHGSTKAESNDRYNFWFNINETEDGSLRDFTFEVKSDKTIYYIEESSYKAHFVTGNNWIDFEFGDGDAIYVVTTNRDGNYEVKITTNKTLLNFTSIGDLNVATLSTQFEIISIAQIQDLFNVTECRTDVGSVLLLGIFFFLAFALIVMGITTNIGFIGVFGALLLWITSWFIAPCIELVSLLFTLLAMLFFFFFIFRGFFPNMYDSKRPN